MTWYLRAAQQHVADAQSNLGALLLTKSSSSNHKVAAYALFSLSTTNSPSDNNPAKRNRSNLTQTMSPQELKAGQLLTRELTKSKDFSKTLLPYMDKSDRRVNHK